MDFLKRNYKKIIFGSALSFAFAWFFFGRKRRVRKSLSDINIDNNHVDHHTDSNADLVERFQICSDLVRNGGVDIVSEDVQLLLYAYFKQATVGPAEESGVNVSFFDYVGKAKFAAWQKLQKTPRSDAMKEYISIVHSLNPNDNPDNSKKQKTWKSTSKMMAEETDETEEQNFLYFCREGNLSEVIHLLEAQSTMSKTNVLDDKDSDGVSGLLWACDRGWVEIVIEILNRGGNIEQEDTSGLRPLHYAAMCNHTDLVKVLLSRGAKADAKDHDGVTPAELCDSPEILVLLQQK
jgi:acyl-CoA-binding protein